MFSILSDVRGTLEAAGFATFLPRPDALTIHFEDLSVLGQVRLFEAGQDIVAAWQQTQDEFLRHNAVRLAADANKAWNLYTVLLSRQRASDEVASRLHAIEEDFRGTRKIARAGLQSRRDIVDALAPILPLQHVVPVGLADARTRLLERLSALDPSLATLLTESKAEVISAKLLGDA